MKAKYFLNVGQLAGLVLGAGFALGASAGGLAVSFTDAGDLALNNNTYSIAVADLMGNGKKDILTADGTVWINTSPGDGSTSFVQGPSVQSAYWITTADVNGDGLPDLIEVNQSNQIAVFLNITQPGDTAPSFAAPVYFNAGNGLSMVVAADVNGDGIPDLLVIDSTINAVDVLINTTTPGTTNPANVTFTNFQSFAAGNVVSWIAAGDLNGDGLTDIVAVNYIDSTVSVFINTGSVGGTVPSFAAQQVFPVGNIPNGVAIADINGDNKPDIVVANNSEGAVSVLLNTTANGSTTVSFAAEETFAVGTMTDMAIAVDLNGDGMPDIVAVNSSDCTISVLINTTTAGATTASFAPQQVYSVGIDPENLVAADLNGDGKVDLAVMNTAGYAGLPTVSPMISN